MVDSKPAWHQRIRVGAFILTVNLPLFTVHCFTVAGQRRTLTGFAFKPFHPGKKAPELR
jgi:hypothetical protein